jgi:uncharacterized protein with PIN domain
MTFATRFRFYEELNDFLEARHRKCEIDYAAAPTETVKHAVEALGVPHTEVELILVNSASVGFEHRLADGDRVSVYPVFECFDVSPLLRVRREPLRLPLRFIADSQLGGLARLLRMLGFDTLYDGGWDDAELRRRAGDERRIILTRDRELLKVRTVMHGCYVHAQAPRRQLAEVVARLQLAAAVRPFTRCLCCNETLVAVDKQRVLAQLPPSVAEQQTRFEQCPACRRVYWPGGHWRRMQRVIDEVLAASATRAGPRRAPAPAGSAGTGNR